MARRVGWIVAAGFVLAMAPASPMAAQQPSNEELKKELESLREMLKGVQKDLSEIKSLLARRVPRPVGIGVVIDPGQSPARGEATAPLTLIEFSDYQCPFCARHFRETSAEIEAKYVETGKVRHVFMDLPLERIHKLAFRAAEAAHCARAQGEFWEMHDRLFANQKTLEPWEAHAEAIGLDVSAFDKCMETSQFSAEIRRDMAEAGKVGVTGTPGFVVGVSEPGGTKVKTLAVLKGARPFNSFKLELDRLLKEAEEPAEEEPGE